MAAKVTAETKKILSEGKARRDQVKRADLAQTHVERRKHAPRDVLNAASTGRIPSLLKLKRQRMGTSAFGFFRGAAALMAYDLSLAPHTGVITQLCGDAHIQNLGAFAGIDGKLIFDINDFDETTRGPFEWDVKRMAASIVLAGSHKGLSRDEVRTAVTACLNAYCKQMRAFAGMPVLEVARFQVRRLSATPPLTKVLATAERASPLRLRNRLTEEAKSGRIFRTQRPTLWRVHGSGRAGVLASLKRYRATLLPERQHFFDQFQPVDVAFKVVGVGAVGLRDYCVYMQGNGPDDPLFLQIKQETPSAYAPYQRKHHGNEIEEGQRVADGQRAMQLQSDPMLGWTHFGGHDYLVRQLNDHKGTLDATALTGPSLAEYGRLCGEILARGHARSGDARLIAGYIGHGDPFVVAIRKFASAYAEQTVRDWAAAKHA